MYIGLLQKYSRKPLLLCPKGSGAHQWDTDDHLPGLWSGGESQCYCAAGWHSGGLDPGSAEGHHQSLRYWSAWPLCLIVIQSTRAGGVGWLRSLDMWVVEVSGREERENSRADGVPNTATVSSKYCHTRRLKRPRFINRRWPWELSNLPQIT